MPDGRYISAVAVADRGLRLFDVATRSWKAFSANHIDNPTWSKDSQFISYHTEGNEIRALRRVSYLGRTDGGDRKPQRVCLARGLVERFFVGWLTPRAPATRRTGDLRPRIRKAVRQICRHQSWPRLVVGAWRPTLSSCRHVYNRPQPGSILVNAVVLNLSFQHPARGSLRWDRHTRDTDRRMRARSPESQHPVPATPPLRS